MLLNPWNRTARFALVGLALMVLGVGACSTSTTTELEVGHKVAIDLTAKAAADIDAINAGLTRYLDSVPGIENVSVGLQESVSGEAAFEIIVWGTGLDAATLKAGLRREVPGLEGSDISSEALTGTFEESFASKLRREVFQFEVDGGTAEEIRAAVMAQLAAEGLDEGAEVEVIQQDGLTEIIVKVEKDVETD